MPFRVDYIEDWGTRVPSPAGSMSNEDYRCFSHKIVKLGVTGLSAFG